MKKTQKQMDEFDGKTCDLIALNQNHIDSIKMSHFTIHKHISSDMEWDGIWVIDWNKIMKDHEIIPNFPHNYFYSLQEAINAVETVLGQ
jgi:hypothetical protein